MVAQLGRVNGPRGCQDRPMGEDDVATMWEANAAAWVELSRAGYDVCRDLVNTPSFLAMLPDVAGLVGIDLGCGEGHNTRLVRDRGARVVGIDISPTFVRAARSEEAGTSGQICYLLASGLQVPVRDASVDFAVGFMSFMDMADPSRALQEAQRVLRPGGFLQFSILHPAMTVPVRRWVNDETTGERIALAIGGYFEEGPLEETWSFGAAPEQLRLKHQPFRVRYARKTLSGWLNDVVAAGLVLEAICEPHADKATAEAHPEVADTRIAPFFLIVRARRP
jgi:SAM-dependent methyltransferase